MGDLAGLQAHLANLRETAFADAAKHHRGRGGLCPGCGDPFPCGSYRIILRAARGAEVYAQRHGLQTPAAPVAGHPSEGDCGEQQDRMA